MKSVSKRRNTWKSLEVVPLEVQRIKFELEETVWNRFQRVFGYITVQDNQQKKMMDEMRCSY